MYHMMSGQRAIIGMIMNEETVIAPNAKVRLADINAG